MKNLFTLLLIFIFHFSFQAQSEKEVNGLIKSVDSLREVDINKSFSVTNKALEMSRKNGYKKGEADSYYTLGNLYKVGSKKEECINSYYSAIEIYKLLKDTLGIANSYIDIGLAYDDFGISENSIEYYLKAYDLIADLGNTKELGMIYSNLSYEYEEKGDLELALSYVDSALYVKRELGDSVEIAYSLNAKGYIYITLLDYKNALKYLLKARDIFHINKKEIGEISTTINIVYILGEQKRYKEALAYLKEARELSYDINNKHYISLTNSYLSSVYYKLNDYKNAYNSLKIHKAYSDSLIDKENTKKLVEIKMQNEFNDELNKIALEQEKKDLVINEELKRSEIIRNSSIGGALLFLILVIVSFRAFKIKKKSNHEIAEKNKEITDSINYAKKLQDALLSPSKETDDELENLFVLFQPKDIVSGDFYWVERIDSNVMFSAIDCTGHGVPGAMLSIVGNNEIENIIHKEGVTNPGNILDKLNNAVISRLKVQGNSEMRDGMDVAFCVLDQNTNILNFAGANNPVYIVRGDEVIVHKGTKNAIGQEFDGVYENKEIQLYKDDCVYVFSDGYVDQFGGKNDKKLGSKEFKNILLQLKEYDMDTQREFLKKTINNWMGDTEQIDDICVIGMKV